MTPTWEDWEQKVLDTFLDGERIRQLPAKLKKRMVLLRWLLEQFDWDRQYTQAELNAILARFHPDTATIRREFIVYGLMDRQDSVYWRIESVGTDRNCP